jgi:hypothetical protein
MRLVVPELFAALMADWVVPCVQAASPPTV